MRWAIICIKNGWKKQGIKTVFIKKRKTKEEKNMAFKTSDLLNYRQLWWLDKFLIGHKGFIAGGCFKNIFNNERVKDLDIFFWSERDFLEAKKYFKQQIKDNPQSWRFTYENKNCWSVYCRTLHGCVD